ncbi:MAG TPA: ATP-binding protein [Candidatus Saccharimonadales bacterium]
MHQGGVKINNQTGRILRFANLVMPIALTCYGLLITLGIADASHYYSDVVFGSIMAVWLTIAILGFVFPKPSHSTMIAGLVTVHILAIFYILLVSGFGSPFTIGWIALLLAAHLHYKRTGLMISVALLIATAVADMLLYSNSQAILATDMFTTLGLLIVGLVIVSISQIQDVDSQELSRSHAHESLERDRILTLINNLADAILSTDQNGVVRIFNAASLNLLDTNTGLDGRKIDDILPLMDQDDNPVSLLDIMKQSRSVVVRDDVRMEVADEIMRLEVTFSPIRSSYSGNADQTSNQDGYIVILRDVTKAKSLEEERDEFISVVSHELRTPITIAEGTLSNVTLMMDRPNIAKKVLSDSVTMAHEQVIFLAKMVNDLSTLSRAERGVADAEEEIDVHNLVKDLFAEYAPQAAKKKLHFDLDLGTKLGSVMASRLYLHELLQNFITNSIKYTKEGGVTVSASNKNGRVTFTVKDTGIGISKADQEKVFKKFYRSEDYRTRETGGTGLGLYVATKLARKLNTKIELSSRLNHGSTFSFSLKANSTDKDNA